MTQSASRTTTSPHKPITRRRIVHGAAWTVPVIAASIAAPALAASQTDCPELPITAWRYSYEGSTTGSGGAAVDFPIDGRRTLWTSKENGYENGSRFNTNVVFRQDVAVEAGRSYTLTFDASANHGNYDKSTSELSGFIVIFGDQQIMATPGAGHASYLSTQSDRETRDATQIPIQAVATDPRPWGSYSYSFVAATTGTFPLMFRIYLPPRQGTRTASDDIAIAEPQLICNS